MEYDTKEKIATSGKTRNSILKAYLSEAKTLREQLASLNQSYNRISWLRLAWIIISAVSIYYLFTIHPFAVIAGIIIAIGLFLFLVTKHLNIDQLKTFTERRLEVNQIEIDYLEGNFTQPVNGSGYLYEDHPYALDLDVFGDKSIFHYFNRTQTQAGADKLALALSKKVDQLTIESRQAAAYELADQLQWRQSFLAKTKSNQSDIKDFEQISQWVRSPHLFLPHEWLNLARKIVPLVTIILMVLVVIYLPLSAVIFVLLIPGYFLSKYAKQITKIHNETEHSFLLLKDYALLIEHIESHTFKSKSLLKLQNQFQRNEINASDSIKKLSYYIRQLNVRMNPFAILLNIFGLWDFHWVFALERWKEQHQHDLDLWIDALGDMDFYISIANATYNHPDWTFPKITETQSMTAINVGHPLIFNKTVIKNDVVMPLEGKIRLITGSNMAGKSTFLRSVGINMVLAYAGFPVLANKLEIPLMEVFTSMRTKDNLHESTSSFYAELKRLRSALQSVQRDTHTFFLLDEILKGTNSVDRHTGSRALIIQLLKLDGAGIIATHDLDLAILEEETKGKMENWCFEVEIKDGELEFDYKIKRGVCSSFNATHLMREMGFDLNQSNN